MGVYIKDLEMPKGCAFCRIGKRNGKKMVCPLCDEEWDIHDPMSADHRLDNCPLAPVPPHGRLIDADALITEFCEWGTRLERGRKLVITMSEAKQAIVDIIEDAPTIIPAEEAHDEIY